MTVRRIPQTLFLLFCAFQQLDPHPAVWICRARRLLFQIQGRKGLWAASSELQSGQHRCSWHSSKVGRQAASQHFPPQLGYMHHAINSLMGLGSNILFRLMEGSLRDQKTIILDGLL